MVDDYRGSSHWQHWVSPVREPKKTGLGERFSKDSGRSEKIHILHVNNPPSLGCIQMCFSSGFAEHLSEIYIPCPAREWPSLRCNSTGYPVMDDHDLPGLVNIQKAIENDHRNSGFTHWQHGGSFKSYVNVYQRVVLKPIRLGIPHDFKKPPSLWARIHDILGTCCTISNHSPPRFDPSSRHVPQQMHTRTGGHVNCAQKRYRSGNVRILKWRYCTIVLARRLGYILIFHRPYTWSVPPILVPVMAIGFESAVSCGICSGPLSIPV